MLERPYCENLPLCEYLDDGNGLIPCSGVKYINRNVFELYYKIFNDSFNDWYVISYENKLCHDKRKNLESPTFFLNERIF